MIKVGITGGIGVGKTYICNILKKWDILFLVQIKFLKK